MHDLSLAELFWTQMYALHFISVLLEFWYCRAEIRVSYSRPKIV